MYGGPLRTSYPLATSKLASISFNNLNVSNMVLNETTGLYSGTVPTPGGNVPGGGVAVMTPNTPYKFMCGNTGDVKDVYGSAQFVGLGFVTFFTISARLAGALLSAPSPAAASTIALLTPPAGARLWCAAGQPPPDPCVCPFDPSPPAPPAPAPPLRSVRRDLRLPLPP